MPYSHRQFAWPWLVLADVLFIAALVCIAVVGDPLVVTGLILVPVSLVLAAFAMLTTRVESDSVVTAFMFGWPRHRIALTDIQRVEIVRNSAWSGWGLRKIPGGWMYNVWGLDAVEITRTNGKKFRIGTDDSIGLEKALRPT